MTGRRIKSQYFRAAGTKEEKDPPKGELAMLARERIKQPKRSGCLRVSVDTEKMAY